MTHTRLAMPKKYLNVRLQTRFSSENKTEIMNDMTKIQNHTHVCTAILLQHCKLK